MRLHARTGLRGAIAGAVFALLNLHCWQPGIGGRTDLVAGERPDGSQLELYYGWPACYRAELLTSDDPGLIGKMLKAAPFFRPPRDEMRPVASYASWPAAALDATFAFVAVGLVMLRSECTQRDSRPRAAAAVSVIAVLLLLVGYRVAPMVSTHL